MRIIYVFLTGLMLSAATYAAEPAAKQPSADPRALIASKLPGVKPADVKLSAANGLYEVRVNGGLAYVTADGKYLFSGDLYEVSTRTNLSEISRTAMRSKALAALKEDQMIIFAPPVVKHTITVFTDVDCSYCRKLHSEMSQINNLGIRVRYLAYPRTGPGSESWRKMEGVWCAKDRRTAITQVILSGQTSAAGKCSDAPVDKQYALGESLGVSGTPAIITDAGEHIGGYLTPQELAAVLAGKSTVHSTVTN